MGEVKDKPYDRTNVAIIEDEGMPQLIAVRDGSTGIFAIDEDGSEALVVNRGQPHSPRKMLGVKIAMSSHKKLLLQAIGALEEVPLGKTISSWRIQMQGRLALTCQAISSDNLPSECPTSCITHL